MDVTAILKKARETYGTKNQILVCIEELNELACVLAKYPRYDDENEARLNLADSVLDEVADVMIILDHVQNILDLSDEQIKDRIHKKVSRLNRWIENSTSMQRTVEDREIENEKDCSTCQRSKPSDDSDYERETLCRTCMSTEATEGIKPYYVKVSENEI